MINYELRDLFNQDSVEKQIKITYENTTITNEDLFGNEMTIEESLCSESQLKFGRCEASMVKFKVANIFSPMIGKTIDISVVLEGNTGSPFLYGRYKVQSDKPTADRKWREVVAYDCMYDIINSDVSDWYNTILPSENSSVTMMEFRKSFINHFGIQEHPVDLINDDMVVKKTIGIKKNEETQDESVISESAALSGKDVITAICEINGCFGHIGRDGKMHYIYLAPNIFGLFPADDLYPSDELYPNNPDNILISKSMYISCKYEDYACQKINKLQIRTEENDIGTIVGDGENAYIIEGNFLAYGKSSAELQEIAENIFEKIKDVSYIPFEVECVGNPCIEVGDAVRIPTTYKIVESYVLKRTLKGIQALRDSLSSSGEENYKEAVNSVHKSIVQLKGKTNKLERTVEETRSTITDVEAGLESQIKQTAGSILGTVASAEKAWDETGYFIEYYGYGTSNYVPSEEYYGKYYLDQASGKVYICKRVSSMDGYYYYWSFVADLPLITAQLNSKIEQTSTAITAEVERAVGAENTLSGRIDVTSENITAEVTRAVGEETSLSGRITVTANDITAEVERAISAEESLSSRINLTADSITAEVERAMGAEGTLSSQIQVTADSISSKVSKGDVVSEINQSADTIELSAGRLVITSGNFTVDSAGNVSMTGNVNAISGTVGPFSITESGLEWGDYGTKIWANTIETSSVTATDGSSSLSIGTDGKMIRLGPYGFPESTTREGVFVGGDMHIERNRHVMCRLTPLIGWSDANYIDIGDPSRNELPNALLIYSQKVQMLDSSGELVDIGSSTSDERKKNVLSQIEQRKAVDFIKNLVPIVYRYKTDDGPVAHWGFGAQTTLSAMRESGIGESRLIERNPYVPGAPINPEDDTTFFYSMRMDEMAAPYAAVLQYILNELEIIKSKTGGTKNADI